MAGEYALSSTVTVGHTFWSSVFSLLCSVINALAVLICFLADIISAELRAKMKEFASAVSENNPEKIVPIYADDCVIIDHGNIINKGKEGEC